MPIQLKSCAMIESAYHKPLVFGLPHKGKTMLTCTAPAPLLLLTEPSGADSLTTANIERVYPKPTVAELETWIKKHKADIKPQELTALVAKYQKNPTDYNGITYDVPRLDVDSPDKFREGMEFLKSDAAKAFETVVLDSASALSKMMLDHFEGSNKSLQRAYGQTAKHVLKVFDDLLALQKHVVFLCHATENLVDISAPGSEEKTFYKYWGPTFEGRVLGREIPHKIGEIYQIEMEMDKAGKPVPFLRTRAKNATYDKERSRNASLLEKEPANLTDLFAKLSGK